SKLDEILRRLNAASTPAVGQAAPYPAAAAPAAPDTAAKASYQPGAVAIAHAAPDTPRALQAIRADSVGGFVYDGGPVSLNDLRAKGVRYTGLAGLELQGWLKVTAAGRTQLAVEYRATTGGNAVIPPSCLVTAWLEDRAIGAETGQIPVPAREEKTIDLILGADLQPGLYRLRLWTACTPTRDLKLNAEVLLKNPADMNLRPVTAVDLLHQGG
ncbi:MAG TPA: hypothetical protein VJY34_20190, partial [Roseiarcus sp.]|nr:hypothetical protein [Roseiarcus sp.]